jgi:hypothetical protein
MSKQQQRSGMRRLKAATARVESQPYRFAGRNRAPRLAPPGALFWCVPSAGISGGSLPPSGSKAGPLTGQTIYYDTPNAATYTALSGTYDVYNPMVSPITSGKMTAVKANGDGTFDCLTQSCL